MYFMKINNKICLSNNCCTPTTPEKNAEETSKLLDKITSSDAFFFTFDEKTNTTLKKN